MPIRTETRLTLDVLAAELCLAVQQERADAVPAILARLETVVRGSLPGDDPSELSDATGEIMQRSLRLAMLARQSALSSLAKLPTNASYNTESGASNTWQLNG